MDSREQLEFVEPITPQALRRHIERGRRLRSEAVASALRAAVRTLRRFLCTPDAVAHERRERARRRRYAWGAGGLSGDGLPGGAR